MKCNLKTFPKAAFPISEMTSAELLNHILKLVHWKFDFKDEIRKIIASTDNPKILIIRDGETYINTKEILGDG